MGEDREPLTKDQVNRLYLEVNEFSLVSHFYWDLWGVIQAMVSDIDYMEYAVHRYDEEKKPKSWPL
ncbi:hypothetical protein BC941DRAFT_473181 [Chlamydoabsidia padenii]|nr:hypothetical protein BC941DRAFT_473181 [Chlamydoabsidia padenii]